MNDSRSPLRQHLLYTPAELRFGTSGRRGEVLHLTQLEIYINALAELQYLQSLPSAEGGITRGDPFYFAYDLRASSSRFVPDQQDRGEIAQAIARAIRDSGMQPVNLGPIPTPALLHYALTQRKGSIMATGSHIPFDRNGYKTNTARGELLKKDEEPINQCVREVRERLYHQPFEESLFNERGMFRSGHSDLPPQSDAARAAYLRRYLSFFPRALLEGRRLVFYQHSAVGRDLLPEILGQLGAEVIATGRSDTFVPIDTEAIDDAQLALIQALYDQAAPAAAGPPALAVLSTDGDSDRPLVVGVHPSTGRLRFFGGDLVGMLAAEYLGADAVVVPISCNDAIERGTLAPLLEPRTRIGSPYVIAGMERASRRGKRAVCGWEANGGFLTGSDFTRNGARLEALPTRDAMLPMLAVLAAALERRLTLEELFARLPARFGRSALLRNFARARGLRIVRRFSPSDARVQEIVYSAGAQPVLRDQDGEPLAATAALAGEAAALRDALSPYFPLESGFGGIERLNFVDGVRIRFSNGDVAHLRPSGNADEMRIYAVAGTEPRADEIARQGVAEPDGILERLAAAAGG